MLHVEGESAFLGNDLVQSAVIRQLEIIGEAVKRLSAELTTAEGSVPRKEIARTRDLLIHGCFRVDVRFVWNMVAHDLVPLGRNVRRILALEED